MTASTRRETMAMLASGLAAGTLLGRSGPAFGQAMAGEAKAPPPAGLAAIDAACSPIVALLPEAALMAGLPEAAPGGPLSGRCNDWTADGNEALPLVALVARGLVGDADASDAAREVRALLDAATATADIRYGRNNPLGATHRPYLVTGFVGPHLVTPSSLQLVQPLGTTADVDAWLARLDAFADALIGAARGVLADRAAGCVPPAATSRAALAQMDAFALTAAAAHPLVQALAARTATLPASVRDPAIRRATVLLERRVQPAMALLRDGVADLTRAGRADIGLWAQPKGDRLHAANIARAGDTGMALADIQALARAEAARTAALLDRRLALRGLRKGTLAERIAAAFSGHPEFIESDDEGGRASLLQTARARLDAARAMLPRIVAKAAADPQPLDLRPLPDGGGIIVGGSLYLPAAIDGGRPATLWLDNRSVHALPVPGVSPLAFHLGLPGLHLLGSTTRIAAPPRSIVARMAAWPAMTEGWACYAERLAAEEGLFARDPWGDIARLSDELLRAARLVVDIGIHAQRWPREQAEAEMHDMTGAIQGAAIDRIVALPGEAAGPTLGLHRLTEMRDGARAKGGRRFDMRAFHAAVLDGGARPLAMVEAAVGAI